VLTWTRYESANATAFQESVREIGWPVAPFAGDASVGVSTLQARDAPANEIQSRSRGMRRMYDRAYISVSPNCTDRASEQFKGTLSFRRNCVSNNALAAFFGLSAPFAISSSEMGG